MGGLVLLAVLIGLLIIVGIPYALLSLSGLRTKISALEKDVSQLKLALNRAGVRGAETPDAKTAHAAAKAHDRAAKSVKPEAKAAVTAQDSPAAPAREKTPRPAAPSSEEGPPRAFVFVSAKTSALGGWLKDNWVLAIAAASLAFAGVFMVQYGVENGILTPFWRVMAALGFGGALIAGGEVMRRRFGDEERESATRYLPSTLSGAGIIVLFVGVLSAKVLYGLIGTNAALTGLSAVSVFAVVLGWFYGPLLAAIGVTGAIIAPFTLSTGSGAPDVLYYYFVLVILMALGIDTVKRWAWISVLGLVLGLGALWYLYLDGTGVVHFVAAVLVVWVATIAIPQRSFKPAQDGSALLDLLSRENGLQLPEFPTRLSVGVTIFASLSVLSVAVGAQNTAEAWLGLGTLVMLAGLSALWLSRAPALYDHVLPPLGAFFAALSIVGLEGGPLTRALLAGVQGDAEITPPETGYVLFTLAGFGAFITLIAFWRMQEAARGGRTSLEMQMWPLVAAVTAPASFLVLEFLWPAKRVIGAYPWALVAISIAALMTLLCERAVRGGGNTAKANAGLLALGALTMIAMALFLVLTKAALSLALAAMVLGIVVLDRKVNLPALGWFAQLGLAVITYRLILDPGLYWAIETASAADAAIAFVGVLLFLGAGWLLLDGEERLSTRLAIEAAGVVIALVGVIVALARLLGDDLFSHWGLGLLATLWGGALLGQLHRLRGTEYRWHRMVRFALMAAFGLFAGFALIAQATLASPLLGFTGSELVLGPLIFDSLALAYIPVALMFAYTAWKYAKPDGVARRALVALAAVFAVTYVIFEIRRLFRGRDLSVFGVTDGELYAYTVAMLVGAGLLLILAFSRRSLPLRKLAMAFVAVTIAKVFLVDMSGLSGLTRVFSFMGLGLALLGLTWVNRLMSAQWDKAAPKVASE